MTNTNEQINIILQNEINQNLPNKINEIKSIMNKSTINKEDSILLTTFITNYMIINNYRLNNSNLSENELSYINWYLNESSQVINDCYTEPITEAKQIVITKFNEQATQDLQQSGKSNGYTRVKLNHGIKYYEEDQNNINLNMNGFSKTLLIVFGIIIFGILLAVIKIRFL